MIGGVLRVIQRIRAAATSHASPDVHLKKNFALHFLYAAKGRDTKQLLES